MEGRTGQRGAEMVTYMSVPHAIAATRPDVWGRDRGGRRYYLGRFHLAFCESSVGDTKMGQKIAVHRAEDAQVETIWSMEATVTTVNFTESIREAVVSDEMAHELAATISSMLGVGGIAAGRISSEARATVRRSLRKTFTARDTLQNTVTKSERQTFTVKNTRNFRETPGTYVTVLPFQLMQVDAYAVWFDYLDVRYRRYPFDIRRKRLKNPPIIDGFRRANEWELREPLGSFFYWRLVPSDAFQVRESKYVLEVPDATVVRREDIQCPRNFRKENYPRVPSLYQVSNVAFPLKWIPRGDDPTESELLATEEDERREGAWWYRYHRRSA